MSAKSRHIPVAHSSSQSAERTLVSDLSAPAALQCSEIQRCRPGYLRSRWTKTHINKTMTTRATLGKNPEWTTTTEQIHTFRKKEKRKAILTAQRTNKVWAGGWVSLIRLTQSAALEPQLHCNGGWRSSPEGSRLRPQIMILFYYRWIRKVWFL